MMQINKLSLGAKSRLILALLLMLLGLSTIVVMPSALASVATSAPQTQESGTQRANTHSLPQRTERDPTRPTVSAEELAPENDRARIRTANLELELIHYSTRGSSAVINGDTYFIGDRLGGWNVQQIEADRVILVRDNEKIILSVFSGVMRSSFKDNS